MPDLDLAVRVEIEKCPIPLVWLDTHVIVRLVQLQQGKLTGPTAAQYKALSQRLSRLTSAGKIICVKADQDDEVWGAERRSFLDAIHRLSFGVDMRHKLAIEEKHTVAMMAAYIRGDRYVHLSYKDAFFRDPIRENVEARTQQFIVTVDMGIFPSIDEVKKQRRSLHDSWERLRADRRAAGIGFEKQRQLELQGRVNALIEMAGDAGRKMLAGHQPDRNEMAAYVDVARMISTWNELGGIPPGKFGLARFIDSLHFAVQPINQVESALVAMLVTGTDPIQSGDEMDVHHIAMMLPFVDMMIVDRRMRHYLNHLGLPKRYSTKVLSSADWQGIDLFLDCVESSGGSV
jgi:hypothetical protein